jgi:hypothetical protein
MNNRMALAAALAAAFFLTACTGAVKIASINADPSRYYKRAVRVDGTVTTSVGILGTGGYQIEDETGKIYVLSRKGVPSSGSRVSVTGSVIGGAQILGTTLGTAIREEHHTVR